MTGGDGSDTTAAAFAFARSTDQLLLADLYLIGDLEDPMAVWLTNWPSPLVWSARGTFNPASIKRGRITSQVGLKVDSLDVTWSPPLTAFGTSVATANPYQLAYQGFFDNKNFKLWRTLMPTPGDANTFGATPWFGGRIQPLEIGRGQIKLTVNSSLDALDQQAPPNVIEMSNTLASYVGNTPVLADGETSIPTFTVVAPSTQTTILGDSIQPTAHKIYTNNKFRLGFMVFLKGSTLAGYWSPIGTNVTFNAGGGLHYNQFQVYGAFPWAPTPGDKFYVSTQWPVDLASATAGQYKGFPYVPYPTTAV